MASSTPVFTSGPNKPASLLSIACGAVFMFGISGSLLAANLPKHFHKNASKDLGSGLQCVVGTATDEDGMNGRAYVYIEDTRTHTIRWTVPIPLRKDWYQNQATHCLGEDQKVYALVQSDTMSQASLSQTFISVVTLNRTSGHIDSVSPVKVPNVHGAISAWVDQDSGHFEQVDGKIVVSGEYLMTNNRDDIRPFTASPQEPSGNGASTTKEK